MEKSDLEKGLADLRSRIGNEFPIQGWNQETSRDAFWHFAQGTGDDNPLWGDEDYGAATRWRSIIAPPTFLYTFSSYSGAMVATGLPGVPALWAEDDWHFKDVVRPGERINASYAVAEVVEREGGWGSIHQYEETIYRRSDGGEVARVRRLWVRGERQRVKEKGKYQPRTKHRYSTEELESIAREYDKDDRRGSVPRYWEDVAVGDSLGQVVKGPLTVTEMMTWLAGSGAPFFRASAVALAYREKHPKAFVADPETGIPDFLMRWHWDEAFAQALGVGGGFDFGNQRISWFSHLLTNWMGDDGSLKRLRVQLRRPHYLADTLWLKGKVAEKRRDGDMLLVDCELNGENQRGETVSIAWATVALPQAHQTA
ncbi:MAG: MaoC family dehydratase N-terminal domain-containing protein [Dehalococcoidia bacterium]|nr:MaoC family dehydratase N-terminal domain-containing protein [Dehalococcoidia bacterium]MDP6782932.1 MaoC family dehydratase N-terminal domain-containing protein [Dehalococcoidia bacterium]